MARPRSRGASLAQVQVRNSNNRLRSRDSNSLIHQASISLTREFEDRRKRDKLLLLLALPDFRAKFTPRIVDEP